MDWKNKRVMITGSMGFIGSNLFAALRSKWAKCFNYDIDFTGRDVCDYAQLRNFIERHDIEFVYHLAAEAHVPIANKYPRTCLETNIMGTVNVLDICASHNIPLILASSDHAYGDADKAFDAGSPLNAKHPYDLSKACADKIAQMYQRRAANAKIMRLCNVYGPGDTHHTRLIPHVVSSYVNGKQPVLRGDPSMVREWIYIDDAVQAYIDAADNDNPVNLVGGYCLSVGQVVEYIREKLGGAAPIVLNTAFDEIVNLVFAPCADNLTSWEEGIARTIEWWKEMG